MLKTIQSSLGAYSPFSDGRVRVHFWGCPEDHSLYRVGADMAAERAEDFAHMRGVRGPILMPDVMSSNGKVCGSGSFRPYLNTRVWNSVLADGVIMSSGQSAVFATGDCPIVVMHVPGGDVTVAAHAGRDSVIGNHVIKRGARQYGVIFEMARFFPEHTRPRVRVAVCVGIAPEHFKHPSVVEGDPIMSDRNARMIEYVRERFGDQCFADVGEGALSLLEVIKAQCEECGIPRENVWHDGVDTFSTKLESGEFAFHSHRRYTEEARTRGDTVVTRGRNILLVEAL